MTGWLIIVDRQADLPKSLVDHPWLTTRDFIMRPKLINKSASKIINLSRDYGYQTLGYYASLLAEARAQKVIPTVTTILTLKSRTTYAYALGELEELLNRTLRRLVEPPGTSFRLLVCLGLCDDARFARLGRVLFDHFRCPIVEVLIRAGDPFRIRKLAPVSIADLDEAGQELLAQAVHEQSRARWRMPKAKVAPRFDLAILHDPKDTLPPSDIATLRHFARIAGGMGLGVELITKKDFDRLPEFDALWLRETTNIDHHTFRFAQRAEQEGMPVIDDPTSIMRCTNKVYLSELLAANGIAAPRTFIISNVKELAELETRLSYPIVLKIPDGSFSRGVTKVGSRAELERSVRGMLEDSDLILAQEFVPTNFDWRVGVLGGEALFVTQYLMAKKHWQIVHHREGGRSAEGGFKTVGIAEAPAEVVRIGVHAARLMGSGLYGVDIKETGDKVYVIEINDNPNLNVDVEAEIEGDTVWRRLAQWYLTKLT